AAGLYCYFCHHLSLSLSLSHTRSLFQVHNLQELQQNAALATKIFIQRDYTGGILCQFQTKFPPELESRVERQYFEETVKTLNSYYTEAEKIGGSSYLEGCLACVTAYVIFMCMETRYEKVLKKIAKYVQEQNEKIYAPRGLLLTDPIERGLRVVSFTPVWLQTTRKIHYTLRYILYRALDKALYPMRGLLLLILL
uniref:Golgin subfamily A member 7/ERF4 domain-containing protein n=1 Tax=Callorhinchus milii TaxID=7868 RepID=A0A4W3H5S4_CALMI